MDPNDYQNDEEDDESMEIQRATSSSTSRVNHCEIERRRRNKMKAAFEELKEMLPSVNHGARVPDKLTVLKLAVTHMRTFRPDILLNPPLGHRVPHFFLRDLGLQNLLAEACDGFQFVVNCHSGQIVYVSNSIQKVLGHNPHLWMGSSIFHHLHEDDVTTFAEQLSTTPSQLSGTNVRILDLKTGTVKRESCRLSSASRRSTSPTGSIRRFICRMRLGTILNSNDHDAPFGLAGSRSRSALLTANSLGPSSTFSNEHNYAVIHCSGYIKKWPSPNPPDEQRPLHLLAVGRRQVTSGPRLMPGGGCTDNEFISRHSTNGKLIFMDGRVLNLLGYFPQEFLGKSFLHFAHFEDHAKIQSFFDQVLQQEVHTIGRMGMRWRCRAKNFAVTGGHWLEVQTSGYAFWNPLDTEVLEFILCINTVAAMTPSRADNVVLETRQRDDGLSQRSGGLEAAQPEWVSGDRREFSEENLQQNLSQNVHPTANYGYHGNGCGNTNFMPMDNEDASQFWD